MTLDTNKLIDTYVNNDDWRIKENSNASYAYPGMLGYVLNHITSKYMLENVYSKEVAEAHKKCFVHIHDLSGMNLYCIGRQQNGKSVERNSAVNQLTNQEDRIHCLT